MPEWDPQKAVKSLRSALADAPTDKFVFRSEVSPPPDGITTTFYVGDIRLVTGSLNVYLNGAVVAPVDFNTNPDLVNGIFTLNTAPGTNINLQASYHHQWFTDDELREFLMNATNLLGLEDIYDPSIPLAARPVIISFAKHTAYMFKAAEFAEAVVASAEGYSVDRSKSHPHWREMARIAWETALKQLEIYRENPLLVGAPILRILSYRLQEYVPHS